MFVPIGYTEKQVIDTIQKIAGYLGPKYARSHWCVDDVRQSVWLWALPMLEKYNPDVGYPLENFLTCSLNNKCKNHIRDTFSRTDGGCKRCADGKPCDKVECGQKMCARHRKFMARNKAKTILSAQGKGFDSTSDDTAQDPVSDNFKTDLIGADLMRKIDDELPMELRADYLRMLSGTLGDKERKEAVRVAIRKILKLGARDCAA